MLVSVLVGNRLASSETPAAGQSPKMGTALAGMTHLFPAPLSLRPRILARTRDGRIVLDAIPMKNGSVCIALDSGPRACTQAFTDDYPIGLFVAAPPRAAPGVRVIAGAARDDVRRVDVRLRGGWRPAHMVSNGYWLLAASSPREIRATLARGRQVELPIDFSLVHR